MPTAGAMYPFSPLSLVPLPPSSSPRDFHTAQEFVISAFSVMLVHLAKLFCLLLMPSGKKFVYFVMLLHSIMSLLMRCSKRFVHFVSPNVNKIDC